MHCACLLTVQRVRVRGSSGSHGAEVAAVEVRSERMLAYFMSGMMVDSPFLACQMEKLKCAIEDRHNLLILRSVRSKATFAKSDPLGRIADDSARSCTV